MAAFGRVRSKSGGPIRQSSGGPGGPGAVRKVITIIASCPEVCRAGYVDLVNFCKTKQKGLNLRYVFKVPGSLEASILKYIGDEVAKETSKCLCHVVLICISGGAAVPASCLQEQRHLQRLIGAGMVKNLADNSESLARSQRKGNATAGITAELVIIAGLPSRNDKFFQLELDAFCKAVGLEPGNYVKHGEVPFLNERVLRCEDADEHEAFLEEDLYAIPIIASCPAELCDLYTQLTVLCNRKQEGLNVTCAFIMPDSVVDPGGAWAHAWKGQIHQTISSAVQRNSRRNVFHAVLVCISGGANCLDEQQYLQKLMAERTFQRIGDDVVERKTISAELVTISGLPPLSPKTTFSLRTFKRELNMFSKLVGLHEGNFLTLKEVEEHIFSGSLHSIESWWKNSGSPTHTEPQPPPPTPPYPEVPVSLKKDRGVSVDVTLVCGRDLDSNTSMDGSFVDAPATPSPNGTFTPSPNGTITPIFTPGQLPRTIGSAAPLPFSQPNIPYVAPVPGIGATPGASQTPLRRNIGPEPGIGATPWRQRNIGPEPGIGATPRTSPQVARLRTGPSQVPPVSCAPIMRTVPSNPSIASAGPPWFSRGAPQQQCGSAEDCRWSNQST